MIVPVIIVLYSTKYTTEKKLLLKLSIVEVAIDTIASGHQLSWCIGSSTIVMHRFIDVLFHP